MNSESLRTSAELLSEDAVRIQISRREADTLHQLRISPRDFFERTKQIVRKAAWRGEDSNFFAQTRFELWLDLLHEYLQAVVNRAMQGVFKEDAIEHAVARSEERRVGKECRS